MENKQGEIAALVDALRGTDAALGYAALKALLEKSTGDGTVAAHLPLFFAMLEEKSAYLRMRAVALIAANAKWDDGTIEKNIARLLRHVTDPKPIAARLCIESLPGLVSAKPHLAEATERALLTADFAGYSDAMRPLLEQAAQAACKAIAALNGSSAAPGSR